MLSVSLISVTINNLKDEDSTQAVARVASTRGKIGLSAIYFQVDLLGGFNKYLLIKLQIKLSTKSYYSKKRLKSVHACMQFITTC